MGFICFLVLLYITSFVTSWALLNDKANKEKKGPGLALFICGLFSAFIFVPATEIFNTNTAIIIWKILAGITCLSSIMILVFHEQMQRQKSYKWSLLPTVFVTIIPYVINITITITNPINIDFNNNYSIESLGIIITVVALLSTIVLIMFIIFTNKTRRKISELNHALLYYRDEYNHLSTFQRPYEKSLKEDLFTLFGQLESKIANILKIKENADRSSDINDTPTSEIHDLHKKIDEIQKVILLLGDKMFDKKTADFDLIRDLNHFFATPFATIEANTELLRNTKGINNDYLEKIRNSIQLCQCIIETYRDCLSFSENHDNIIGSLKQTIETAFRGYTEQNKKHLKPLNTNSVPERFKYHNNHYIVSLLLPLLENAIQAAPNDTEITIAFNDNDNIITISNICINTPTLTDLETPGYSSKENHKGTGIMIVKNLLSVKNRGILKTTIDNNKVIQTIKLNDHE